MSAWIKVSPSFSLIPLGWIRESYGFTPSGAKKFLESLKIPTVDLADYRGHVPSDDDLYVNSAAYEAALLGASLPEGPEWGMIRVNPEALAGFMGFLALIYGVPEREALQERLRLLGEDILTGTLRDMRIKGQKAVPGLAHKTDPPPRILKVVHKRKPSSPA